MTTEAERIAKSLTEPQRRALGKACRVPARGAYWPAGTYCRADKRVRYNLAAQSLITDYLHVENRLTHLGLAVRSYLMEQSHD